MFIDPGQLLVRDWSNHVLVWYNVPLLPPVTYPIFHRMIPVGTFGNSLHGPPPVELRENMYPVQQIKFVYTDCILNIAHIELFSQW